MIKLALLFAVLFVSTHASPFPFLGGFNDPYNLDTPDDGQQGGQVNAADQVNERGDTPDDGEEAAAGQAGTTVSPGGGSSSGSSGSSEEEDDGSDVPEEPGTTAIPAGPIVGNQPAGTGGQQGAGAAGGNSNGVAAVGGPNYAPQQGGAAAQAGDSSQGNVNVDPGTGIANPLKLGKPQAVKNKEARRSGAVIGAATLILVAGVATVSVFAYKYKDAITGRLGL